MSARDRAGPTSPADRLPALRAEYDEVERALADPAVHADQARARTLGRRFAELAPDRGRRRANWTRRRDDLAAARELAAEDAGFAAEAQTLDGQVDAAGDAAARAAAARRTRTTARTCILEVKAGEGGDESALFAGDLLRMYLRYAERQGWATEVLDEEPTDLGGDQVGHGRGPVPAAGRRRCGPG